MIEEPQSEESIRKLIRDMLLEAGLENQEVNDIFGLINTICDMKMGEGESNAS